MELLDMKIAPVAAWGRVVSLKPLGETHRIVSLSHISEILDEPFQYHPTLCGRIMLLILGGGRYRSRTCDLIRVKDALYH